MKLTNQQQNILKTLALCSLAGTTSSALAATQGRITANEFNPAVSLILNGTYTHIEDSELNLPGFQLGGEAGLPSSGFALGHNELAISANIDDKFYGSSYFAIVYDGGETEVELEEAFLETLSLGNGFTVRGGRFFSGIGYLNAVHDHAHDFADRPLAYDALFGGHLVDTGVQATWTAPTSIYLQLGLEITSGTEYPSGPQATSDRGRALFAKLGNDIGDSSSWQLGLSHYESSFDTREAGADHQHGGHEEEAESVDNELKDGDVEITGIDLVYKWAPQGNRRHRNLTLQAEYFVRTENGLAEFTEGDEAASAVYDGEQSAWYLQAVYQFKPAWRVGLRYDALSADNRISNFEGELPEDEFLEESGLGTEDDPKRHSIMLDYSPSHFSRLRFQYSNLNNGTTQDSNEIFQIQYLMSLGAHGAHTF